MKNILDEEMFKYLKMNISKEWKLLLFKDRFNFAGIDENAYENKVTCTFDLENHIPSNLRYVFLATIAEYIKLNYKYLEEKLLKIRCDPDKDNVSLQITNISKERKNINEVDPYVGSDAAINAMENLELVNSMAELEDVQFSREVLQKVISTRMYEIVEEMELTKRKAKVYFRKAQQNRDYIPEEEYEEMKKENDRWSFEPRLGSYLNPTAPTLEFVKYLCKIFACDSSVESTVNWIKKGCLRLLNKHEFADESVFYEPSLELILPQTTCTNCQLSRNINICKEFDQDKNGWACIECNDLFKKHYLEKKLIDLLNTRLIAYSIQDLECTKCSIIKNSMLKSLCDCTGKYKNTHCDIELKQLQNKNLLNEHSSIKTLLELLKNIARMQDMKLLHSISTSKLRVIS